MARSSRAVYLGRTVKLQCSAAGALLVDWKRKGGHLTSRHTKHPNGSLVVRSVTSQDAGTYICTARNIYRAIEHTTRLTVKSLLPSCSHIKVAGRSSGSKNYVIDPDGAGGQAPFTVYCDMSNKNGVGVTVVSHDSEARTHVKGCGGTGCYSKDVTYSGGASVGQLAGLAEVSSYCEQMIKFECKDDVSFIEGKDAWWVSRDGSEMFYWGGATPDSGKCACGMTNTCKPRGTSCNCENAGGAGGSGWREDSGLLTSKSRLPVTQLRFGDVDQPHEEGYHTLGKLKCYGRV